MDVRPHPHIGLATVTYLFSGAIQHKDSLGSDLRIEPGAINWMVAGRGVVHSERSPQDLRETGFEINGLQCWVALPAAEEERTPSFHHHPASTLPEWFEGQHKLRLLMGNLHGRVSPVEVFSPMFYMDVQLQPGAPWSWTPPEDQEWAVYVTHGRLKVDDEELPAFSLGVGEVNAPTELTCEEPSRCVVIGGASLGERQMFWNFVASTPELMEQGKKNWSLFASGQPNELFTPVPSDDRECIPLPG